MNLQYVLCNAEMLALAPPLQVSKPIPHYTYSVEYVALYDLAGVPQDEEAYDAVGAFFRECGPCNTEIPYDADRIREEGLWEYIEGFGISSLRNRAVALHEVTRNSPAANPVEFVDSVLAAMPRDGAGGWAVLHMRPVNDREALANLIVDSLFQASGRELNIHYPVSTGRVTIGGDTNMYAAADAILAAGWRQPITNDAHACPECGGNGLCFACTEASQ